MTTHRRSRLALVTLSGLVILGLSACGASTLTRDDVSSTIVRQLKQQGITVDNDTVACPEDLQAEVGQTVRCGFTAGGQPTDAVATVSSVDGDDVNLQIATEARPVPQALLERTVAELLVKSGIPADGVSCAGELQPQVGQIQTCTVRASDQERPLTAKVTEVRGGLVNFSIAQA